MMRWGASPYPDDRYWSNSSMMWGWGQNPTLWWLHGILAIITWVLFIAVLVALLRWLWKKGDKAR